MAKILFVFGVACIGSAVGLMAALFTLAEGFDERLEDLSWVVAHPKAHVKTVVSKRTNR
jgi:hypothetical protein